MKRTNMDIRYLMKKHKVKQYEVAERCGYSESRFSVLMARELMDEDKQTVIDAIKAIEKEK